ncbi:MAG: phosphate--acyl-ACP acyltransferase, partial [Butyricicoccaceae bacterium]
MKIIIDAMSGDNAPLAQVRGAVMAAKQYGQEYILVGQEEVVRPLIEQEGGKDLPITVQNATEIVDMHDDPSTVLRKKKDSSMAVSFQMVAKGEGDAMISAGNTGALLSGATLIAKRIKGIRRAALPPMLPTATGQVMLIDAGANAECTPEYLLQFA